MIEYERLEQIKAELENNVTDLPSIIIKLLEQIEENTRK